MFDLWVLVRSVGAASSIPDANGVGGVGGIYAGSLGRDGDGDAGMGGRRSRR